MLGALQLSDHGFPLLQLSDKLGTVGLSMGSPGVGVIVLLLVLLHLVLGLAYLVLIQTTHLLSISLALGELFHVGCQIVRLHLGITQLLLHLGKGRPVRLQLLDTNLLFLDLFLELNGQGLFIFNLGGDLVNFKVFLGQLLFKLLLVILQVHDRLRG